MASKIKMTSKLTGNSELVTAKQRQTIESNPHTAGKYTFEEPAKAPAEVSKPAAKVEEAPKELKTKHPLEDQHGGH